MSQFWNTPSNAGPTTWDVLRFWDRVPRHLRPKTPPPPPPFGIWKAPERLTITEAAELTGFLNKYYRGEDWMLDVQEDWIADCLLEPTTIALGIRNEFGDIVGSLVCRSIGKRVKIGTAMLPTAYMIEGLCIHPSWRGKHLAGWLIAWIDHIKNDTPQAFFWSREAMPKDLTYVASHTYAHIDLDNLDNLDNLDAGTEIPWTLFRELWEQKAKHWSMEAAFPTILPKDPLRVWETNTREGKVYIVISDTRRRTNGRIIWEVQFLGTLTNPLGGHKDARKMLEAVGLRGILFATSAPWQGGADTSWKWRVGGAHTTYLYNFMPPTFHRLPTLFLRNEL